MNNVIINVLLMMTVMLYPVVVAGVIYIVVKNRSEKSDINKKELELLDKRTTLLTKTIDYKKYEHLRVDINSYDVYKRELDDMISIYTDTVMNEEHGVKMSVNMSMAVELSADDYVKIVQSVTERMFKDMSNSMKAFLFTYMGVGYLTRYIRFRVIQVSLQLATNSRLEVRAGGVK